ncbi:hypothetical protein AAIA72_00750 [Hahella sp. SMD15-11]|uniref:Uncharacterized protein n=1 Tax=Thermohahella caldifontis TaxID=3142973 RepID=A0AB39UW62_9GAMM
MNNDERYIEIVRACLRALNATVRGESDRTAAIESAYRAIDDAFSAQFKDYQQLIAELTQTLNTIAHTTDAAQARALAQEALQKLGGGQAAH